MTQDAPPPTEADWAVIDRVHQRITAGNYELDLTQLAEPERNFLAAYVAQGVIDNGGYYYFFEAGFPHDPDYQLFARAFEGIGATEAAQSMRDAIALLPGGKRMPDDPELRDAVLDERFKFTYEKTAPIDAIEDKILGREENYTLMARYAREHLSYLLCEPDKAQD